MYCSENHYGSECGRMCIPADDDEHGHYTCSNEGEKICREGMCKHQKHPPHHRKVFRWYL